MAFKKWGNAGQETAFERQLKRGAEKIVAEADGKICGDCASYTGTSCLANTSSSTGGSLMIAIPTAPACRLWEEAKSRKS